MPAARRKASFQQTTWTLLDVLTQGRGGQAKGRAGQGRPGQARPGQARAGQGRSPLHWCPFGVPKSEFGSLAENGRFLNKPLIWKCYFPVPAALVPMEMLFSPVPAALVPIWRPKINYLGALPKMVDF